MTLVPKRQVMFISDGFWYVWTGSSRDASDPAAYRLWRPWHPADWLARVRQSAFTRRAYGTYPHAFAERLRGSEPSVSGWRAHIAPAGRSGEVTMGDGTQIPVDVTRWTVDPDGTRWTVRPVGDALGRYLTPWAYPDRNPWPTFVPLPALERARIGAQEARGRLRDAWAVLCGRESIYDDRSEW